MRIPRIARIAGAGLVAVAAAGAVVVITASAAGLPLVPFSATPQTPAAGSPGADRQAQCQAFMGSFAAALGKSPADVQAAAQSAFATTVDDAVKAGKLTQAQADAMKQKFQQAGVCSGLAAAHGAAHPGAGAPGAGGIRAKVEGYEAAALGMTPDALKSALGAGRTVKDLAAAKGMDEAAFRAKLVDAARADLDQAVKAGKLTQAQEDMAIKALQAAPIPGWNGPMAGHGAKPTPRPTS